MKKEDLFLAIGMAEDEDLLESELSMAQPRRGKAMRKLVTLAAVAALLTGLAVTASATGLIDRIIAKLSPAEKPGEALEEAYSGSISAEKPELFSAFGKPIEMPDMERVEVDPTEAERLMGDYVSSAEGSIEAGGNTIRLKNFVMDEIGLGAVTFTIENPNGVPYEDAGYGVINLGGVPGQSLWEPYVGMKCSDGSEKSVNNWNYLVSEKKDALEVVMYVGTLSDPIAGQPLVLHFSYGADYQKADIEITPLSFAPSITLTEESGKTMKLSSQGVAITCNSDKEWSTKRLVVHFADGTEYTVEGEGQYNHNLGYWRITNIEQTAEDERMMIHRAHYDELMYLFNRLIDPAQVTSVELDYIWSETILHGDGTKPEDYENIEHLETLVYYPE